MFNKEESRGNVRCLLLWELELVWVFNVIVKETFRFSLFVNSVEKCWYSWRVGKSIKLRSCVFSDLKSIIADITIDPPPLQRTHFLKSNCNIYISRGYNKWVFIDIFLRKDNTFQWNRLTCFLNYRLIMWLFIISPKVQMPCVQFVKPLVSFVLLVQPCSSIKSVTGLVLMTQFVY